jgi:hypothetical protein
MTSSSDLYAFVYRGILARQAADDCRRDDSSQGKIERLISRLPFRLMDEAVVSRAREMAVIYTAIAAFENVAREFIEKRLLEEVGDSWWQCMPEKRRVKAESRRDEENRVRWHAKRGDSPLHYAELEDLASIIVTNHAHFEAIIEDVEWVKNIFKTVERSRNIIMHSGYLEAEDVERLGMVLRDWLAQVGG